MHLCVCVTGSRTDAVIDRYSAAATSYHIPASRRLHHSTPGSCDHGTSGPQRRHWRQLVTYCWQWQWRCQHVCWHHWQRQCDAKEYGDATHSQQHGLYGAPPIAWVCAMLTRSLIIWLVFVLGYHVYNKFSTWLYVSLDHIIKCIQLVQIVFENFAKFYAFPDATATILHFPASCCSREWSLTANSVCSWFCVTIHKFTYAGTRLLQGCSSFYWLYTIDSLMNLMHLFVHVLHVKVFICIVALSAGHVELQWQLSIKSMMFFLELQTTIVYSHNLIALCSDSGAIITEPYITVQTEGRRRLSNHEHIPRFRHSI